MTALKTLALAALLATGSIWTQINESAASPAVFSELQKSAPRSGDIFADINATAPKADVFTEISLVAPRADIFDSLAKTAPRADGVFGDVMRNAP